jgi:hypothetical protein
MVATRVSKRLALVVGGVLAGTAGAKDVPTTCADICNTLTSTSCTISSVHDVVSGSDVDCSSARALHVSGGELRVHDGQFTLRGKSLDLDSSGKITADCPQAFENIGFRIVVQEGVTFVTNGGGKMSARCSAGGGSILLDTGGAVALAALGIDVGASAADAPGGSLRIDAGGDVTVGAAITADAYGGSAPGGTIDIRSGGNISVLAEVRAKGYGGTTVEKPGGDVTLEAEGDVTITGGVGLNVETSAGAGGDVSIEAEGLVDVQKPIRASGTTGPTGAGGGIGLQGNEVRINGDLIARGGREGGAITAEARAGGISVGTSAVVNVEANGNNGEPAGSITFDARGSGVTVGANAVLKANGVGGGSPGGEIRLVGVDVQTAGGSQLQANGANPNAGGIYVEARGALTINGAMSANNGGGLIFTYRTGTPTIGNGVSGYELVERSWLSPACGDGIRAGSEACDGGDLGDQTCSSQGHGTGALGCASSCVFDTTGCSN